MTNARAYLTMRATTHTLRRAALFAALAACSNDRSAGPEFVAQSRHGIGPNAAVLPPSSYTASFYKPTGGFRDVNGRNLIVGTAGGNAVAVILGGPLSTLQNGGGIASRAEAVNHRGGIVGAVDVGTPQQPHEVPAYWPRMTSPPITLRDWGEARDINDLGLVVGTIWTPQGYGAAYVWNPMAGSVDLLPPISGGSNTNAVAINNDNIILGWSDGWTVLWQHDGSSWVVRKVDLYYQGIAGADIDAGYGIVGHTMWMASFGDPHHAGYFHMSSLGRSYATAVTGRGIVTGWDEGVLPPGVPPSYGFGTAFIADRSGATTYLPYPAGAWFASAGHGVNECGLVVGEIWKQTAGYPAVWDPGC